MFKTQIKQSWAFLTKIYINLYLKNGIQKAGQKLKSFAVLRHVITDGRGTSTTVGNHQSRLQHPPPKSLQSNDLARAGCPAAASTSSFFCVLRGTNCLLTFLHFRVIFIVWKRKKLKRALIPKVWWAARPASIEWRRAKALSVATQNTRQIVNNFCSLFNFKPV